jgi:hypothetical protein
MSERERERERWGSVPVDSNSPFAVYEISGTEQGCRPCNGSHEPT